MALADPQSVTIGGVANSLPRTGSGDNHGQFTKDDRTVTLKVTHNPNKTRARRSVRLDFSKIAADPLLAGVNREASMTAFVNIDVPLVGLTLTEQKDVVKGLIAALTASSDALLIKIIGGES
jgi:hypothetical protein